MPRQQSLISGSCRFPSAWPRWLPQTPQDTAGGWKNRTCRLSKEWIFYPSFHCLNGLYKWLVNHDFGFHLEQKGKQHLQDPVQLRAPFLLLAPPGHHTQGAMQAQDCWSQHKQLGLLKKIQGLEKQEEARWIRSISSACPTGRTGGWSLRLLLAR